VSNRDPIGKYLRCVYW